MHGKFAVIKLWPELKTAEDECIARLKITARSLGLECLEVNSFAQLVDPPHAQLTRDDIDFVLSLHFETPKRYDIFSFVALWNPLQFFHDWGYRQFTRNLLTHDDFLSCSSPWADDHVKRHLASDPMRDGPAFHLYHSLSEPIFPPTTGDGKLFYAGINWERLGKKPQRHGDLLRLLDKTGDLRIYGPKLFKEVDVWSGFDSYKGPIPFDGVSIIRTIHRAGISLVLSSEAHRESELMSSRLFESLAAGAVVICDDHPFARRFFGDTLLYIDTTMGGEEAYAQVQSHLEWIRSEPEKARALAKEAQDIFRNELALDRCLQRIYDELPARKQKLECLYTPKTQEKISLILLMPEFRPEVLERHIASCLAQKHVSMRPILAMDQRDRELFGGRVEARLSELPVPIEIAAVKYFERYPAGGAKVRRRSGQTIHEVIENLVQDDYFCIVSPNERLFSDHLCSLLRTLQDCEEDGSAWAEMLLRHTSDGKVFADLNDPPETHYWLPNKPIGYGRFLIRKSALPPDLETVLPYLNALPMDLLSGIGKRHPTKRCTLVMDIADGCNLESADARPEQERELFLDYAPSIFGKSRTDHERPVSLSTDWMTQEQKTKLAVELAHSVPFPEFVKKIAFGVYRLWLRVYNARSD